MDQEELELIKSLQEDFWSELEEQLDFIEQGLLKLEAEGWELDLNPVTRVLHSLKGSAFASELQEVGELLHETESKLSASKDDHQQVSDWCIKALDKIRGIAKDASDSAA